jgi:oligopeptide/dipeptide ABC transporter ATP-binding protein
VTDSLLQVDGLTVTLPVEGEQRRVLRNVSLEIGQGEAVGLVGESGSGKSMTARAVARILPPRAIVEGTITFDGRDVAALRSGALRQYRGEVAVVFQDARAHTNPVRTIGDFMTEALRTVRGVRGSDARRRAADILGEVGIDDGERRLKQYPHQLSGGMLQRVMIGAALLTEPRLLLADEPTTALDVTTQAEVMAILDELRRERGLALLFITHDLDLAAVLCDRTLVMYAGRIVEDLPADALDSAAQHPYTRALVAAVPDMTTDLDQPLAVIPGRPVDPADVPPGCAYAARCPLATARCRAEDPPLVTEPDGRRVACWHAGEPIAIEIQDRELVELEEVEAS